MRFDWYQTTIDDKPESVIGLLSKLGHELRPADSLAKKYHFRQGWQVENYQHGVVATIFAGGNGNKPHAFASSNATDAFVDLVRNEWPERHLVSRLDAAQDFIQAHAFDKLRPVTRRIAKRYRLKYPSYSDELNPCAGRTQYIGSPSSDYRGRLYEKGWEEVGKIIERTKAKGTSESPEEFSGILNTLTGEIVKPQDWTRLELQVRPRQEEGRRFAATATPEQAWALSPWAADLAKEAMALELERIVIRTRKVSSDEKALRWMCQHYGAMLGRLHDDLGDWPCVGLEIGRILKVMSDEKA